jgi:hypothetical protein
MILNEAEHLPSYSQAQNYKIDQVKGMSGKTCFVWNCHFWFEGLVLPGKAPEPV